MKDTNILPHIIRIEIVLPHNIVDQDGENDRKYLQSQPDFSGYFLEKKQKTKQSFPVAQNDNICIIWLLEFSSDP